MRDRTLETRFLRFRDDGDVAALGDVFDAVAPELRRVALGLVRERSDADDLVQATFLTALERAERWDSGERLVPWLVGILVHHARAARRRGARRPDLERLAVREVEEPATELERAEVRAALERALAELSDEDREVLEPVLRDGRRPRELAAERGVAPGTMRMRLSRALERLRLRLPKSAALGGLLPILRPDGLSAVRAEVLARASARVATSTSATAAGVAPGLLTGIVMTNKLVLLLSFVVLVAGLGWFGRAALGGGASDDLRRPVVEQASLRSASTARDLVAAGEPAASRAPSVADAGERTPATGARSAHLSGLVGRVVEADGAPVVGEPVTLFELRADDVLVDRHATAEDLIDEARVVVDRARTDAEGRFRLEGARRGATQFLGVDVGGPRSTVRQVETALVPGELHDLGDVRLEPTNPVRGRAVDEQGRPLAGVRVRAGCLEERVLAFPVEDVTEETRVLSSRGDRVDGVCDLSSLVRSFVLSASLATVVTGEDGTFELARAAGGGPTLLFDAPGRVPCRRAVDGAGAMDLGDVLLAPGRGLTGRVVDHEGRPAPAAEVLAGRAARQGVHLEFLGERTTTDADGAFALEGLPGEGALVLAARGAGSHAWTRLSLADVPAGVAVDVPLVAPCALEVTVVDSEGAPIEGARCRVRPSGELLGAQLSGLLVAEATEPIGVEDGVVRFEGLGEGRRVLQVEVPGLGRVEERLELAGELTRKTVTFAPRAVRRLRVIDAATRAPIAGASVEPASSRDADVAGVVETDAEGLAVLRPGAERADWRVRVSHPAYASKTLELDAQAEESTCAMGQGGALRVLVFEGGEPREGALVQVGPELVSGDGPLQLPRVERTDAEGVAFFDRLEPGSVTVGLGGRSSSTVSPIEWLVAASGPGDDLRSARVVEGVTEELRIGDAYGRGELAGRVRGTGVELPRTVVVLQRHHSSEEPRITLVDDDGTFRFEELEPGAYDVSLQLVGDQDARLSGLLREERVELAADEGRWIDFDLALAPLDVTVVDEAGAAVEGAQVVASWNGPRRSTSSFPVVGWTAADGRARLWVGDRVEHVVEASHADVGRTRVEVVGDGSVRLVLAGGDVLAGTVHLPDADYSGPVSLSFVRSGGNLGSLTREVVAKDGRATFEVRGVSEGTWSVFATIDGQMASLSFVEVPAGGRTNIDLHLARPGSIGAPPSRD